MCPILSETPQYAMEEFLTLLSLTKDVLKYARNKHYLKLISNRYVKKHLKKTPAFLKKVI